MKRLLTILLLGLCLVACTQHSTYWGTLLDIESYIEERPDSALVVLEQIDISQLSNKEEKAKHAVLLSMALDKNFVDKTDFEVLQPAIDYYEDNGSATDKLRTYYYQGRIYQNAGNNSLAMKAFVNAISEGEKSDDMLTKARVYFAQATIYYSLNEFDQYIETNKKAATYFKKEGKYNSYANCLNRIINGYTLKDDAESALPYIDECKHLLGGLSIQRISDFYSSYITYLSNYGTEQQVTEAINQYIFIVPSSKIEWLTIVQAYRKIGNYNKAMSILDKYDVGNNKHEEIKYKALISVVYEKLGKHEEALRAYKEYMVVSDSTHFAIMQQDTKFVVERHNLEMAKAKESEAKNKRTIAILACVVALIGSLLVIFVIHRRLQQSRNKNRELEIEKRYFEWMYMKVLSERDELNEMLSTTNVKGMTADIIKKRLSVLNTIIVSYVSEKETDVKRANEELEHLIADREEFINTTRLTLEDNYPHFFAYLRDRGLEEHEIDFCCLYAIGMKGKEVKAYTNLSRHYKDSSEVRHKLGLSESDTNLSNFLQKLLKNAVE